MQYVSCTGGEHCRVYCKLPWRWGQGETVSNSPPPTRILRTFELALNPRKTRYSFSIPSVSWKHREAKKKRTRLFEPETSCLLAFHGRGLESRSLHGREVDTFEIRFVFWDVSTGRERHQVWVWTMFHRENDRPCCLFLYPTTLDFVAQMFTVK